MGGDLFRAENNPLRTPTPLGGCALAAPRLLLLPPLRLRLGRELGRQVTCSEVPSWGWRLGEGCAGHPLASCEPLRTCGSRWPPTTGRAKPAAASRAHSGRSHFYAASCDRLFRFCRLRQFALTFRLKLPFWASFASSFSLALLALPLPLFFFLPSSFTTTTALIDAHHPKTRTGCASCGQPTSGCVERRAR